jgi:hypothetical protein
MQTLDQATFSHLLQDSDIKPRLKKELKFIASTSHLNADWTQYELIAITDRTGDKGILLLQPEATLYIAQYELARRIVDSVTGRDRAIICDLCYTWQPGANAASISFTHALTKHTVRFLCCGDLACSQHVRTATKASVASRAHLRESLSNEDRVARLTRKLLAIIDQLGLPPMIIE